MNWSYGPRRAQSTMGLSSSTDACALHVNKATGGNTPCRLGMATSYEIKVPNELVS